MRASPASAEALNLPSSLVMNLRKTLFLLAAIVLTFPIICLTELPRPKILGIAYVKLATSQLSRARSFYGGELALPSQNLTNESALFALNSYQSLYLVQMPGPLPAVHLLEVAWATSDLAAMRAYLLAKGITAGQIRTVSARSPYFELTDPEGHRQIFIEQHRATPALASNTALSHELISAGFLVQNTDAEDRFYRQILGFHLYWQGGVHDNETNWIALQVPDGTDWIDLGVNVTADQRKELARIMNHVTLGVPNVAAAVRDLEHRGYLEFEDPILARDGKWQLNLFDPDATRIAIQEFIPAQKPCCAEYSGAHPTP
jgi:catechol 2,3-dioxygenase-like lactoylglutathione lyase family enzyme